MLAHKWFAQFGFAPPHTTRFVETLGTSETNLVLHMSRRLRDRRLDANAAVTVATFDRKAPSYDDHAKATPSWKPVFDLLQPLLPAGAHVLDIGCGTGSLLANILSASPSAHAVGIELSPGMLQQAVNKLEAQPHDVRSRVKLALVDDPTLSSLKGRSDLVPETLFDAVYAVLVLHHVHPEHLAGVVDAAFGMVKPGGHIYVVDFASSETASPKPATASASIEAGLTLALMRRWTAPRGFGEPVTVGTYNLQHGSNELPCIAVKAQRVVSQAQGCA